MRKAIFLAPLFLITFCHPEDKPTDCTDPGSTYEEVNCANLKFKEADKKLNDVFKKTKAEMSKSQVKLLVAAQKGWLQLRDNQCQLEVFSYSGAPGSSAKYVDCLTKLTSQRTLQLESTPTDSTSE